MRLPIDYTTADWQTRKKAREQYIEEQSGLCYYCNCFLDGDPPDHVLNLPITESLFPENFFQWPVHLHHDHETGLTIGAVHCYCNAVLWEHHNE